MVNIVNVIQDVIDYFYAAGELSLDYISGTLFMALVLLTVWGAVVLLIGRKWSDKAAKKLTGNFFARYTLLTYIGNFFLKSPMLFEYGANLKEYQKPAFYEVGNRTNMAPMMCLFPHVNPSEMYIWLGIFTGVVNGYGTEAGACLIACTFGLGFVTSFVDGLIIERMTLYLGRKKGIDWNELESRKSS